MRTRSLLAIIAFIGCSVAMAQSNRVSLGLELGLPMGDFGESTSLGIGGSLGFELPMGDNLGLVAQAGYLSFAGKDYDLGLVTVEGANWAMIPVQVGAKYYFSENQLGFYAMALVGIHNMSYTIPGFDFLGVTTPDTKVSDTNLSFAPALGILVGENIDLAVRYQIISGDGGSTSYLGLRAAYVFGSR